MILRRVPENQSSFSQAAAIDSSPAPDPPSPESEEERDHAARRKYRWCSPPTIGSSHGAPAGSRQSLRAGDRPYVARWDGARWTLVFSTEVGVPIPEAQPPRAITLAATPDRLLLGGTGFGLLGPVGSYDGTTWSDLGLLAWSEEEYGSTPVSAFGFWKGALVAGGGFVTGSLSEPTYAVVRYSAAGWQGFGSGIGSPYTWSEPWFTVTGGEVESLAEYRGHLYLGGAFTYAGGRRSSGIARWDGD